MRLSRTSALLALLACSRLALADAPPLPVEPAFPSARIIKITEDGAIPDGKTLCSDAIKKAIDDCAAAGGGIVEFAKTDAGAEYLTGPIQLKSNITLQVDEGVTLKFTTDRALFPIVKTRYECVDVMNYSPLIYAYQCANIRITGKGTLDGQGQAWWTWARTTSARRAGGAAAGATPLRGANSGQGVGPDPAGLRTMLDFTNDRAGQYPLETRILADKVPGFRPTFIEPYDCNGVVIEGITIRQSPFWNIHPLYSKNVIVRGVTVFGDGPNTDGCDPDSCNTVLIDHCNFTTGDDCIAIKSGRDGDGIRRNAPCENLTIRDCTMKGGHGAITMGSETSAGIRHVFAENCAVDGPDSAIRLKTTRGRGGGIEDVFIRNMAVTSTRQYAITINMMYSRTQPAPVSETTPVVRDIRIENFTCDNSRQALEVIGLAESNVQNVSLKNITIKAAQGARLQYVAGFTRDNVTITPQSGEPWTLTDVSETK